jgi:hypothetical protein
MAEIHWPEQGLCCKDSQPCAGRLKTT